jgi:hypothetical protein
MGTEVRTRVLTSVPTLVPTAQVSIPGQRDALTCAFPLTPHPFLRCAPISRPPSICEKQKMHIKGGRETRGGG